MTLEDKYDTIETDKVTQLNAGDVTMDSTLGWGLLQMALVLASTVAAIHIRRSWTNIGSILITGYAGYHAVDNLQAVALRFPPEQVARGLVLTCFIVLLAVCFWAANRFEDWRYERKHPHKDTEAAE